MPPFHEQDQRFQSSARRTGLIRFVIAFTVAILFTSALLGVVYHLATRSNAPFRQNHEVAPLAQSATPFEAIRNILSPASPVATVFEPPADDDRSDSGTALTDSSTQTRPSAQARDVVAGTNQPPHKTITPLGRVLGAHSQQTPIIERFYTTISQISGITADDLASIEARINARIDNILSPPPFPQQIAGNGSAGFGFAPAAAQRIDQLANVTITNPTIIGGSFSGTSAAATIANFTAIELIATNATTTNLYVSCAFLGKATRESCGRRPANPEHGDHLILP